MDGSDGPAEAAVETTDDVGQAPGEEATPGRFGDLRGRVVIALPAAVLAVGAVAVGSLALAIALGVLGALAARELYRMAERLRPADAVGIASVAVLPAAALYGGLTVAMLVLLLTLPAAFAAVARRGPVAGGPWAAGATPAIALTMLGPAWIGLPLAHGVLLRELPDGALLVVGALVATFLGDTAAHLVGAALGRRPLAPRLSPRKTVEGLVAGMLVGTVSAALFLALAAPVLGMGEALLVGGAVALAAPAGDLFESLVKRDFRVKDTGRTLGPHGGVLDRIDAVLFAAVAAYYVVRLLH